MKGRIEALVLKAEKKGKSVVKETTTPNPYVQQLVDECDRLIKILKSR